jgi:hypothetical protein
MFEFMSHSINWLGMSPASIVTTVFGAFCVTFVVIVCWGRLVKDFGPIGGMLAAGFIIGTFWLLNHKLPGFGINPEGIPHPEGGQKQFGLIYQGFGGSAPWVDMGTAIGFGMWVGGLYEAARGQRFKLAVESIPRVGAAILGGVIGGVITGLVGWTGANLFGYR